MPDVKNRINGIIDNKHPFSTDRAITRVEEDQLNRTHFSNQLADALSAWSEKDSLVLAIYGNWGDGKTSVKNMLRQCLASNSNSSVEMLDFNPWQWSHADSLASSFFQELRSLLMKDKETNQSLIEKWENYSEYLNIANDVLYPIQDNIKNIVTFFSFLLMFFSVKLDGYLSFILLVGAIGIFVASYSVRFLSAIASLWLRYKKVGRKSLSLEEIKQELSNELEKSKKTFLIVVDDIDRLNPEEMKNIFTLIKANADFPQIIYLTLFQRDIVEKSLEKNGIFSGREYLEKIVQVGIDLPSTPPAGIHHILFKKLDILLGQYGESQKFEKGRWNQLFNEGVGNYFKNLRDVNRFISALSFQLGALYKNGKLEVNFIDLIGMEVLRLHEVAVYKALFESKDILTVSPSSGINRRSNEESKEHILGIIKKASNGYEENVKQIIEVLFPNVRYAWSNYHVSVTQDHFIKLQICHPDRFNRYFSFYMTDADFSEYEYQEFLQSTGSYDKLMDIFMSYQKAERLEAFIGKLEFYKQKVPAENAQTFLTAIFALSDIVSDEYKGMHYTSPFTTLNRVVLWYLKKKEFNKNRSDVFKNAIRGTVGFVLPVQDLYDEWERRKDSTYPDLYSLKPEEKEDAKKLLLEKINQNKDSDLFKNHSQIFRILWIWQKFEPLEVLNWLDANLKNDEYFVDFCNRLMSKSFSSSGYDSVIHHYLPIDSLKLLFSEPKEVVTRLIGLKGKFESISKYELLFKSLDRAIDSLNNPEKYKNRMYDHEDEFDEE